MALVVENFKTAASVALSNNPRNDAVSGFFAFRIVEVFSNPPVQV